MPSCFPLSYISDLFSWVVWYGCLSAVLHVECVAALLSHCTHGCSVCVWLLCLLLSSALLCVASMCCSLLITSVVCVCGVYCVLVPVLRTHCSLARIATNLDTGTHKHTQKPPQPVGPSSACVVAFNDQVVTFNDRSQLVGSFTWPSSVPLEVLVGDLGESRCASRHVRHDGRVGCPRPRCLRRRPASLRPP